MRKRKTTRTHVINKITNLTLLIDLLYFSDEEVEH